MGIKTVQFIKSSKSINDCPELKLPEFVFAGRSNVGKSSLINMLTRKKDLAKVSSLPGKTRLINHFLINDSWYLVDLPGYGYAKMAKSMRGEISSMINKFIDQNKNLYCLMILIDSSIKPQKNDIDFINNSGKKNIPLAIIFTKTDKPSKPELQRNIELFKDLMFQEWETLPAIFYTSTKKKSGKDEITEFIESSLV